MKCLPGDALFRVQCCTGVMLKKKHQQHFVDTEMSSFWHGGTYLDNYILGIFSFFMKKRTCVIIYKEYFGLTLVYSSSRSTELNLASTSVDVRTTNCSMPVSWKHPTITTKVCKNSGYSCSHYVSCLQRQDITYLLVKFTCMV